MEIHRNFIGKLEVAALRLDQPMPSLALEKQHLSQAVSGAFLAPDWPEHLGDRISCVGGRQDGQVSQ